MAGWVYILSNPAMPGLFKVGYTDRDPFSRAKEISQATGVPFDFIVEYQIYVSHPYELEQKTHKLLHNHRVNNNREFFNCSYEDVVEAIKTAIDYLYNQLNDFVSGSESSYKIEKEILERKLAKKKEAQRQFDLWKEECINAQKSGLAKNIAELNALQKKEIQDIEKKFTKPPFFRRLLLFLMWIVFSPIAVLTVYIAVMGGNISLFEKFGTVAFIMVPFYNFFLYKIGRFLFERITDFVDHFLDKEKLEILNKIQISYENKKASLYQEYNIAVHQINEKKQ